MHIAERLYTAGYISYPRTESSAYPPSFDLLEPLRMQRSHESYGDYVEDLLQRGISKPKTGHDAGDHPPM
jgi:DNA topoisomerase-3